MQKMKKLQVGDSVRTQWDGYPKETRRVVSGTVVDVKVGHARSKVYAVEMADTGTVETVYPDQIV